MAISYRKICTELLEAICTFSGDDSAKINTKFTNGTNCIYSDMMVEFITPEGEHTIIKADNKWRHTVVNTRSGTEVDDVI